MRNVAIVFVLAWFAASAMANVASFPATPSVAVDPSGEAPSLRQSTCPDQGGILNSVSVPKGDPLELVILIGAPAPEGGASFRLSSDDPAVAAVGDPQQGFLPEVHIPEGSTVSNSFTVFGTEVGGTLLRATALTPGFFGFAVPLGTWDVGDQGQDAFLDPNRPGSHCRVDDDSPELSTDESQLAGCGELAEGVVTDGVSRLLMRARSGLSGTACFEIVSSGPGEQGEIDTQVKLTSNADGVQQASSYYRAPASYGDGGNSRQVEIEFAFTPDFGNGNTTRIRAKTTLVRPPVVLVHGVWSSSGAWRRFWIQNNASRTTFVGDYENSNDASFLDNVDNVRQFVANAVEESRDKGYATTQADVIGHSMGGLLTRLYAQDADYARPDNFDEGDVRRLLTLATPHFGSSFANLIVALHSVEPELTEESIGDVVPGNAQIVNGAVCDLAENSPVLAQLSAGTELPARLVTATNGPAGTPEEPAEFWGGRFGRSNFEGELTSSECIDRPFPFFTCAERRFRFPQDIVDGHRFREGNDAIVPVSSARGGLTGGAVSNFELLHFGAPTVAGVTNRRVVSNESLPLLDVALDSEAWTDRFPGVQSDGAGGPRTVPGVPEGNDTEIYAIQCGDNGPLQPSQAPDPSRKSATAQGDMRVLIVEPIDGQVFAPGDVVPVTVALEPGLEANDIQLRVPAFGRFEGTNFDGETYEVEVPIPNEIAGSITLIGQITDTAGNRIQGPAVAIAVRPTVEPDEIYLIQRSHRLDLATQGEARIRLIGVYAHDGEDGDEVERDITSSAAGTVYTSSDPSVVTVDADGRLSAAGLGVAVVTVDHAGLQEFATVIVRNDRQPLPPANVSEQLDVQFSGFRLNRNTGFFVQQVEITNNGNLPVVGPLYAVLSGLPEQVRLINNSGRTRTLQPVDSPYFSLFLATDGLTLGPGESVHLQLEFLNPDRVGIDYQLAVLRTAAQP